ncbi:isoflavone 7-O-methyltransferase [Cajanus cajan]|uniref:isoflavone 7-O-methyltransferase n=1 Tax=Cajanus cajan TaxID=3821 RepID=A0A151TCJ0_CAJCA|nr:isoflavone 7-O-methyltransferase [Cajanus cajan]KYP64758.1 Isoflavone-7-O-methyltransferase 9 [Cajanus cajan]
MASINGRSANEMFQGQALLYRHLYAFIDSMCLKWIVELRIPDIIHNHAKPITLPELVSILQIPPTKVGQVQSLMRYLSHNGFFERVRIHENFEEKEAYALTAASELLVKSSELSLAPMVECVLDPTLSDSYHHLKKWVHQEDVTLFKISLGSHFWDFLTKNPAYNESFNDAMASDSQISNLALRDCKLVFEGLESIVDVGGGTGTTATIISQAFPNLKCIVFDRPQVVHNLSGTNNLAFVGGDMFSSIPKADAVLLKWILHNWSDKDCVKILKNCKEAISTNGKKGKVIIIDVVINENQDQHEVTELKLLMDVNMACVNGKERSEEEWMKLFKEAGFQGYKISPLTGYLSLIEIYP